MHVLLVGAELEENLATRYLAAALARAGHTASLAGYAGPAELRAVVERAIAERPEVVGLSVTFQRRAHEFGALADALRAAGYRGHVTCGGHFPTFAWSTFLDRYPSIDSAVRHEGEETLPALCEALAASGSRIGNDALAGLAGVAYRARSGQLVANDPRPLCADLDALPFPVRAGPPPLHLGIPTAFLVGSRGCYGHCTFCCINGWVNEAGGARYRARSADNIADEIAELRRTRGARLLIFHDDDFFTRDRARDLARMTALRDALRRRGVDDIALVVKARPDDVDPDVFEVLREIGLLRVYLGIEAGSTQGLRTLGRGVDLATNRRGLDRMRALGVYACFNMLLFDPDSTLPSLRSSLSFLRRATDFPMNFCRTEIYVGTPLHKRLAREGRLVGDEFGWDYRIADDGAERAFRVFARAFLDRNFRGDGLMNSNLGLGYHLHLLKHFYPHALTPSLWGMASGVIERVNLDCVERMERIVEFAGSPAAANEDAVAAFTERTTREVREADEFLEEQVRRASRTLVEAARTSRVRTQPRWRSVAAATFALAPLSSATSALAEERPAGEGRVLLADASVPDGKTPQKGQKGKPKPIPPEVYVVDPVPPPNDPPPPPPDPPPPPHVTPDKKKPDKKPDKKKPDKKKPPGEKKAK